MLVELLPENLIGINGTEPLLSGEVYLKSSAYNVLDITEVVPPPEVVERADWEKTARIGREAQTWNDVHEILKS